MKRATGGEWCGRSGECFLSWVSTVPISAAGEMSPGGGPRCGHAGRRRERRARAAGSPPAGDVADHGREGESGSGVAGGERVEGGVFE